MALPTAPLDSHVNDAHDRASTIAVISQTTGVASHVTMLLVVALRNDTMLYVHICIHIYIYTHLLPAEAKHKHFDP